VLEVVLQPGEGVRHFRRRRHRGAGKRIRRSPRGVRGEKETLNTGGWRRWELSCDFEFRDSSRR
jgi:hypothetical protein